MKLTSKQRLILFIALSLAIHIALLGMDSSLTQVTQNEQGDSWLQLQLQPKNVREDMKNIPQESMVDEKPARKPRTHTTVERTLPALLETASIQSQPADSTESNNNKSTEIENNIPETKEADVVQVNRIIADEFASNFYYPATARRRNWQGDVVLQFTLMPDGSIKHIRINKSSGYPVLDDAAMDVMSKIKSERQLALVLSGNTLDHLLPVSYRLQDAL
ncbi:MAG TPA: TonB family protein [Gammaproteobacteria bacterium]